MKSLGLIKFTIFGAETMICQHAEYLKAIFKVGGIELSEYKEYII